MKCNHKSSYFPNNVTKHRSAEGLRVYYKTVSHDSRVWIPLEIYIFNLPKYFQKLFGGYLLPNLKIKDNYDEKQ